MDKFACGTARDRILAGKARANLGAQRAEAQQHATPDPGEKAATGEALRHLIENASSEERAHINGLTEDQQRRLVEANWRKNS